MRVLSERYLMNMNMTGLDVFQKSLHPCALDEYSLSIVSVDQFISESHPTAALQPVISGIEY